MNLLNNAVKFTPVGGRVAVTVTGDGRDAFLRVEDTGAGIPADLLPRIFELFVQGDTSLHRARAGLGIGLTLVKTLTSLHRGRVSAHSDGPGQGSSFILRIPASAPPVTTLNHVEPTDDKIVAAVNLKARVLIVDDNVDTAKAMAASLAGGARKGVFLGNFAQQHPQAAPVQPVRLASFH